MNPSDLRAPEGSAASLSEPYRAGLARRELRFQRCTHCGHPQLPPAYACRRCGDADLAWCTASGRGLVHAVTVVERAPSDAFRPLVPYTLVLCTLEEGARIMAHGSAGLRIGQPVRATWFEHQGCTLIRFVPA